MDTERPDFSFHIPTGAFLGKSSFPFLSPIRTHHSFGIDVMPASKSLAKGLFDTPWKSSIVANATSDCVYMPFWEWQLNIMQASLHGFQILEESSNYMESLSKQHRMVTLIASSDEYRYIRMTYLDGGDKVQIFTSVLYPRTNLPLFGMDLLQFQNGKRNLAICDFQPLHSNEGDHDALYEHLLEPIRRASPNLQEEMTTRFFDPSRYFSQQTLLGRFQDMDHPLDGIRQEFWPAYQAYLQTHIQMVQQQQQSSPTSTPEQVLQYHRDYDNYVAESDPAHPMFAAYFGPDVAESYVYDVLFPLADKPDKLKQRKGP
jgi:15,16-dihydrobiliverdin:ferredoxin oxidoreductase